MSEEVPTEKVENPDDLGVAWTSLVLGIASIAFAFLLIPGFIAIFVGRRARMRLLKLPDGRTGATIAFCGMMLGGLSLFIGVMEIFAAPTANPHNSRAYAARATCVAIESAANNFYNEYGQIPNVGDRVTTDSAMGVKFLRILLANEDHSSNKENLRDIKFLAVKEGKRSSRKDGLIYADNGSAPEGLFDPWGNPYTVILDSNADEQLPFEIAGKPVTLKGRRVAIFSPGADHRFGTSDDVMTWSQ